MVHVKFLTLSRGSKLCRCSKALTLCRSNVEECRDGCAKTAETRCRDGNVQARHVIQRLHKQPHSYIISYACLKILLRVMLRDYWEEQFLRQLNDVGMGLLV